MRRRQITVVLALFAVVGIACSSPDVGKADDNLKKGDTTNGKGKDKKPKGGDDEDSDPPAKREAAPPAAAPQTNADAGVPPTKCTTDVQCGGQGRICEGMVCVAGCRDERGCVSGQTCKNKLCVAGTGNGTGACSTDTQCALGRICTGMSCVPGCRVLEDCPLGDTCISGQCLFDPDQGSGGETCTTNAQCALGKVCTLGECSPGCSSDLDCPGVQQCLSNQCF
jgi:hypothetical protein